MRGIQVGDLVELTSEATFSRWAEKVYEGRGDYWDEGEGDCVGGDEISVRRGAVVMKWGSYPLIEVIGRERLRVLLSVWKRQRVMGRQVNSVWER